MLLVYNIVSDSHPCPVMDFLAFASAMTVSLVGTLTVVFWEQCACLPVVYFARWCGRHMPSTSTSPPVTSHDAHPNIVIPTGPPSQVHPSCCGVLSAPSNALLSSCNSKGKIVHDLTHSRYTWSDVHRTAACWCTSALGLTNCSCCFSTSPSHSSLEWLTISIYRRNLFGDRPADLQSHALQI